jgi:hypothetical protein
MKGPFITRIKFFWLLALAGTPLVFSADSADAVKVDGNKAKPSEKAQAASKGTKTASGKDGKPVTPAASPTDGLSAFCRLLPLGEKNQNVKIPSFTDGIRTSLINARTMTRVDDDHMEMEGMDMLLKGETDGQDLSVKLHVATYDMPSAVLSSDQRSRVSRNDFQIEGDSLVFDTHTQQGKMVGHVQMIIFDSDMLKGKSQDTTKPDNKPTEKADKEEKTEKPAADSAAAEVPKKETK